MGPKKNCKIITRSNVHDKDRQLRQGILGEERRQLRRNRVTKIKKYEKPVKKKAGKSKKGKKTTKSKNLQKQINNLVTQKFQQLKLKSQAQLQQKLKYQTEIKQLKQKSQIQIQQLKLKYQTQLQQKLKYQTQIKQLKLKSQIQIKQLKLKSQIQIQQLKDKYQIQQFRQKIQLQQQKKSVIIRKFYQNQSYANQSEYLKMLIEVSQIKNNIQSKAINIQYKKDLRNWIFQCLNKICQTINQELQDSNPRRMYEILKNKQIDATYWLLKKVQPFYLSIIDNQETFLAGFKLGDKESIFRRMIIESTFNWLIHICQNKMKQQAEKQDQQTKIKQEKQFWEELEISLSRLTQLSIRSSIVEEDLNVSKPAINQVLQTIKSSWYLRQVYRCYFDHLANEKVIKKGVFNHQNIKQKMQKLSISFIDYAWNNFNGISSTKNPFLIFVNLFRFGLQSQKFKTNLNSSEEAKKKQQQHKGFLQSYLIIVLLHQIAHTLYRSLQAIQDEEQSNPDNPKEKDGGDLFQSFIFGGKVPYYLYDDYEKIKILFNFKQIPSFGTIYITPTPKFFVKTKQKQPQQQISWDENSKFIMQKKQNIEYAKGLFGCLIKSKQQQQNSQQMSIQQGQQKYKSKQIQIQGEIEKKQSINSKIREAFRFMRKMGQRDESSFSCDSAKAINQKKPLPCNFRINKDKNKYFMFSTLTPRDRVIQHMTAFRK